MYYESGKLYIVLCNEISTDYSGVVIPPSFWRTVAHVGSFAYALCSGTLYLRVFCYPRTDTRGDLVKHILTVLPHAAN